MEVLRNSLRDNLSFRRKLNNQFRFIMVDEYQDTNVVQKEIVEYLSEGSGMFWLLVMMLRVYIHSEVQIMRIF